MEFYSQNIDNQGIFMKFWNWWWKHLSIGLWTY